MRYASMVLALSLAFTGAGYVRRTWLPPRIVVVTNTDGSRDRSLPGKARRKARRQR